MIDLIINNWQMILFFSLGWCLKMFRDAVRNNYFDVKYKLNIPDSWDWYCDPHKSFENKNRNWLWKLFTPFSDLYHTLASLMLLSFLISLQQELFFTVVIWLIAILFGNLIYKLVK